MAVANTWPGYSAETIIGQFAGAACRRPLSAGLTCYYGHTMVKVTFTLDDATIARLERTAARLGWPKSQVVREAVLEFESRANTIGSSERARLVAAVDRIARRPATRGAEDLEKELASVRTARGGTGAAGSKEEP